MKKDYTCQTKRIIKFFVSYTKSWFFQERWLFLLFVFAALSMTNITTTAQVVYQGVAPVQTPIGGFAIDGDAFSNTPIVNVGDWFYEAGGTGGAILDANGDPIYPLTTFYVDALSGDPDLTTFLSSNKIDHHPNTYEWGEGNVPNKNEIQNVGFHFTYGDGVGSSLDDLWCLFAADREVTNGSSYIDFEFLQKLYQ